MADQPTTPSGSRWEPTPGEQPADQSVDGVDDTTPTAAAAPVPPPATGEADGTVPSGAYVLDPVAEDRRTRQRRVAALAGAATALTLGGGIVGFVIGHSTAGNDDNGFRPANFSGQQPGPGQFRDRDGDHVGQQPPGLDGDGSFPGPPGGDDGPSGSGSTSGSGTSANPT